MKRLLQILSWVALGCTLLLPVLFFADQVTLDQMKLGLLGCAALWFLTAPFWMEHRTTD